MGQQESFIKHPTDGSFILPAREETLLSIAGLNLPPWDDLVGVETDAVTETYTFKKDTVTVATVTVIFSDATKTFISRITKS